jgi:hypothetical protein
MADGVVAVVIRLLLFLLVRKAIDESLLLVYVPENENTS